MLNWIWMGMIVVGIIVAALLGRLAGDDGIVTGMFDSIKVAIMGILLPLSAVMMLWLGIMRLAEKSGMISALSRFIAPILRLIFPQVPKDHPAMGAIIMNMAANILGLGNSATPLGLKAMQELETLNPHKGVATNAMCTFLAINTSSVTIIPATAIGLLAAQGMDKPYAIVSTTIGATLCSTFVAILAVKFFEKLPMFSVERAVAKKRRKQESATDEATSDSGADDEDAEETLRPLGTFGITAVIAIFVLFAGIVALEARPDWRTGIQDTLGLGSVVEQMNAQAADLDEQEMENTGILRWVMAFSVAAIPFILFFFIAYAAIRGVRVYEEFVEGAKEGWKVVIRIMPFLVAMIAALTIMRNSGTLFLLKNAMGGLLSFLKFPPDLLPMALMRPLSGSGSQGVLIELLTNPAISEATKYTAATMYGSTETTFYVLAVYFGSVAIRRTRHALAAGLCADLAGVIAAVVICRIVFGG